MSTETRIALDKAKAERDARLKYDVAIALDINPDFGPLVLVDPETRAVRDVRTAFGDPIVGWSVKLRKEGILVDSMVSP